MRADIEDVLSDAKRREQAGISGFANTVWQAFVSDSRKERWSRPWALYALLKWCEINQVSR